ncbi:MAG: GxxExxY protein [Bacteroidales bacterium]|nr:GxxExxY protein [Bacteroidales bacterium]
MTDKIIKAFNTVYGTLGYGFLDKVYEKALIIELRKMELHAERQKAVKVYYESLEIGDFIADIIVEDKVVIEVKAAEQMEPEHEAQLLNCLKATGLEEGVLLIFGKIPQYMRKSLVKKEKNLSE